MRARFDPSAAGALLLYAMLSVALFGRTVVPEPDDRVVGDAGADKTLYMWALEWWPSAVRRAHNPLDVDAVWAPHGFDLGLGTANAGLALVAAPFSRSLGLVATYNLLALAAPALAAWTCFLLARRITRQVAPSLVAGQVYGFSSYELGHLIGHLPLAFAALVPLVPYLVLRRHAEDLSRVAFLGAFAVLLAAQFMVSTQVFFGLLVAAVTTSGSALLALGYHATRRTLAEVGAASAVALVLVSPVLVYAVASDAAAPARSPFAESADVLNFVVPTRRTWLRPPGSEAITSRFTGVGAEQGAYLGLPLLVLSVFAADGARRSRPRLVLVLAFAGAVLLALGPRVKVAGEVVAIGPWAALAPLPVLGSALPNRLTLFTALLAGLLVALALTDHPRSRTRWILAAAGIAATLPNLQLSLWASDVPRPRVFASSSLVVPPRSTVLVLPYGPAGWSMLWQAESRFAFRLVGGHLGLRVTPAELPWRDVYEALGSGRLEPRRLCRFLRAHAVDTIVITGGTSRRMRAAVAHATHQRPERLADALVYDLESGRCDYRSTGTGPGRGSAARRRVATRNSVAAAV